VLADLSPSQSILRSAQLPPVKARDLLNRDLGIGGKGVTKKKKAPAFRYDSDSSDDEFADNPDEPSLELNDNELQQACVDFPLLSV
jgi:hypothetical protein